MAVKEALYPSDGFPPHVYKAEVSIQRSGQPGWNRIRQEEHAYVLATLVSQLEKGFTISPASRQLDGKLRLVHFGPMESAEVISVLEKAYQGGQHVNDERVGYEEIDVLRIGFKEEEARWRRVCIDGKIIRVEKDGWVEVRAGQKGVVDLVV
jgi:diacylglycerol kinase family enzyme